MPLTALGRHLAATSLQLLPTMPQRLSFVLTSALGIALSERSGVAGFAVAPSMTGVGANLPLAHQFSSTTNNNNANHYYSPRMFSTDEAMNDSTAEEVTADPRSGSSNSSRSSSSPLPFDIVGVVFDMDGTITNHCIDFADLRRRIYDIADEDFGGPDKHDGGCVLELAEKLSPDGHAKAQAVFQEIEQKAIDDMTFMDGLVDLCKFIDESGIKRAILTRNVGRSVDAMHDRLLDNEGISGFYPALARDSTCEEGNPIPAKPAPDAILHICKVWNCNPANVIMVGDSPADDIVAGYRAGCGARVLLAEGGMVRDNDSGNGGAIDEEEARQRTPCITVNSLQELRDLLRDNQ